MKKLIILLAFPLLAIGQERKKVELTYEQWKQVYQTISLSQEYILKGTPPPGVTLEQAGGVYSSLDGFKKELERQLQDTTKRK